MTGNNARTTDFTSREGVKNTRLCGDLANALSTTRQQVERTIASHMLAPYENLNYNAMSSQEVAGIRQFKSTAYILSHEFDLALTAINDLKMRIEQFSSACTRFTSAIGRLPAEILAEIFMLLRHRYLRVGRTCLRVSFSPAQVCRRWRSVALSTPRLWNNIYIHATKDTNEEGIQEQLTMLSRAKPVPPYLVVGLPAVHVRFLQRCNKGLLRAFENQCKGLEVYAIRNFRNFKYSEFECSKVHKWLARFTKLERLALMTCKPDAELMAVTATCAKLTHLHLQLQGGDGSAQTSFPTSVMPNLKVFILELHSSLCLDVTSLPLSYPQLTDFFFLGRLTDGSVPFSHTRIERVAIQGGNCERFLTLATLPSLAELTMRVNDSFEDDLSRFLLRSKCSVARLGLIHYAFGRYFGEERYAVRLNLTALGRKMSRSFAIPTVEYESQWDDAQVLKELKERWYE